MYGREKRVLLRHYLEQGLTKTELAQKLGATGTLRKPVDPAALLKLALDAPSRAA